MHVLLRVQGDRRIVSFGYVVGLLDVRRCRWPPECVSFDPKDPFESLTCVKVQDLEWCDLHNCIGSGDVCTRDLTLSTRVWRRGRFVEED